MSKSGSLSLARKELADAGSTMTDSENFLPTDAVLEGAHGIALVVTLVTGRVMNRHRWKFMLFLIQIHAEEVNLLIFHRFFINCN